MAEGYRVVGFDIERHVYGDHAYPAPFVLQDVLTLHGAQFKEASLIVASPPCQAYSYRAMPWKRAKALPPPDNTLFEACFRLQREACEASGRYIPLVVENVCGAQKWVGKAVWHYGSFYLWGDVPALMPIVRRVRKGHGGAWFKNADTADGTYGPGNFRNGVDGAKNNGDWFGRVVAHNTTSGHGQNPDGRKTQRHQTIVTVNSHTRHLTNPDEHRKNDIAHAADGHKQRGSGAEWWRGEVGSFSSRSRSRKAASAQIAKIPFPLARHIARAWKPEKAHP